MVQILRVRTRWSGFSGAPGFTQLHFRDFASGGTGPDATDATQAQGAYNRTRTFFMAIRGFLPENVSLQVEGDVDVLEDSTGELVNSYGVSSEAPLVGTATGAYSAASGAVVNWKTGGIRNGRRIRGRTFLVPVSSTFYTNQGVLASTARGNIQEAAAALALNTGTPDLGVYARPSAAGAADGQWSVVTSATVPDMIAVLRSRRD